VGQCALDLGCWLLDVGCRILGWLGVFTMYLFVYYKFKPQAYPTIERDAHALIAAIEQSVPGVRARLLKRPEVSATGEHTWMETYELNAQQQTALVSRLSELVDRSGLPGERRQEWFVDV
jgi:hypothetical protein